MNDPIFLSQDIRGYPRGPPVRKNLKNNLIFYAKFRVFPDMNSSGGIVKRMEKLILSFGMATRVNHLILTVFFVKEGLQHEG